VIHRVFAESLSEGTANENLDWWTSSDGTRLQDQELRVSAKRIGNTIYALLIPIPSRTTH
jgi:hypothetical protein